MAVGWDAIAAADLALRALDVPLLIAQAIPVSPTRVKWVEEAQVNLVAGVPTTGDITTWTDRTLSTNPAARAYDGKPHYVTSPDATADSTWFLAFEFSSAGIAFDCALLMGHNFDTLSLTTIEFQVADTNDFQTNLRTVASWTLRGSDKRISDVELFHTGSDPLRYKDVQYGWLKLSKGSNFTPEVGELVLGRSRQLESQILLPFDDLAMEHSVEATESDGGVITGSVRYQRRRDLIGELLLTESAGIDDIRDWYRQVRATFAFIWEPTTNPNDWQLMWLNSKLRMANTGHTSRRLAIDSVEQGPHRFYLDNEIN